MQLTTLQIANALIGTDADSIALLHRIHQAKLLKIGAAELLSRPTNKRPLAHMLTNAGLLGKLPPDLITPELLEVQDTNGETLLHLAARSLTIEHVPAESQRPHHYRIANNDGHAPIHLAADFRVAPSVPQHLLSDPDLFCLPDRRGNTPLHTMAREGTLDLIAPGVLTKQHLSLFNDRGVTVAHEATQSACSMMVVGELFDDVMLESSDNNGVTVLDMVAASLVEYDEPLPPDLAKRAAAHLAGNPEVVARSLSVASVRKEMLGRIDNIRPPAISLPEQAAAKMHPRVEIVSEMDMSR